MICVIKNYQSETAIIRSIVKDWNSDALKEAVGTLQPGSWQAELNHANMLFNQKYLSRKPPKKGSDPVPDAS